MCLTIQNNHSPCSIVSYIPFYLGYWLHCIWVFDTLCHTGDGHMFLYCACPSCNLLCCLITGNNWWHMITDDICCVWSVDSDRDSFVSPSKPYLLEDWFLKVSVNRGANCSPTNGLTQFPPLSVQRQSSVSFHSRWEYRASARGSIYELPPQKRESYLVKWHSNCQHKNDRVSVDEETPHHHSK